MSQVHPGMMESWTRIERPPTGFTAPLVVALVHLDEGRRVFAVVEAPEAPPIGTHVQIRWSDDGRALLV